MPAPNLVRPRERLTALVAVGLVQLLLGFALVSGLRVAVTARGEVLERLVEVALPRTPPPVSPVPPKSAAVHRAATAPKAERKPVGGSTGPAPARAPPSVETIMPVRSSAAPSGGGAGIGPALASGAGGGAGGQGYGSGDGGTDLVKIAGDISSSDYPRSLGNAGIGGRVGVTFTVETNGRVTNCRVTRSSGISQLDALTCRLMEERFRFRPSTDRYGRPIRDEVDWDHDWIVSR